jgi:peptidoglycan/LPS O-acetylase OafA/YrhL
MSASEKSTFRPDLEGLRAVAVVLVLLYHARVPLVTGGYVGVDVFFVLSGFLITGLLIRELTSTGRVDFAAFYARRARRLLPASALTLIVTVIAAAFLIPPVRMPDVAGDTIAAGLYVSNMRFALQATDYLGSALPPSPILHFWSLGVEEQFYFFWPAMLALVAGVAFRAGRRDIGLRRIGTTLAVVFVASLVFSIWLTGVAQPWAFFSLPARAWELALGGLLSLPLAATMVPRRIAPWLGWAGVALIVAAGFVLNDGTRFPGFAVLLPTIGSALVIASGLTPKAKAKTAPAPEVKHAAAPQASIRATGGSLRDRRAAAPSWTPDAERATPAERELPRYLLPATLLSLSPMRYLGRISYSLYLWHWPILVLPAAFVGDELPLPVRLLLALASVGVAALSQRFVEDPIRRGRFVGLASRRGLAMAGALSLAVALVSVSSNVFAMTKLNATGPDAGGSTTDVPLPSDSGLATASAKPTATAKPGTTPRPGASASSSAGPTDTPSPSPSPTLGPPPGGPVPADLAPSLADAATDLPVIYSNGCHLDVLTSQLPNCAFGSTNSQITVVLFGDSHAAQWFPALQRLAGQHSWRLEPMTKSACTPASLTVYNAQVDRAYTECDQWRQQVFARIAHEKPTLVVVSTSRVYQLMVGGQQVSAADRPDLWTRGLTKTMQTLAASATHVVLLGDTPRSVGDPPGCLSQHMGNSLACATPYSQAVDLGQVTLETGVANTTGTTFVDPTSWVCRTDPCPAIYGRFLIYRDQGHLTKTYASGLSSQLFGELPALP